MVYSRLVELSYHTKPTKEAKNHVKYVNGKPHTWTKKMPPLQAA